MQQKNRSAQTPEEQFRLTEKLAAYHDQLFSIENEIEQRYRVELENIAESLSEQAGPATDTVLDGLLAESEVLQIKLRTIQEQAKGLQQAIDNQHQGTSDERQQLVQELAALQKQDLQVNRELLYNRQAQTLNKLGAPSRIKKKLIASQISQFEAQKFVGDLITHSLDRNILLGKIRSCLQKAIADAGITQAQIKLDNMLPADPVRRELLKPRTHRVDWF